MGTSLNTMGNDYSTDIQSSEDPGAAPTANLDRLFQADLLALSHVEEHQKQEISSSDVVPWHAEYFIDDLAVSASGTVGILTSKGTSTLQLFWRRKTERAVAPPRSSEVAVIAINDQSTRSDIQTEMEPSVQAILSSNKVSDEGALRKNLLLMAEKLQSVASSIPESSSNQWWLSRLGLDLFIDASGNISPTLGVSGQAQARLEWFRLKRAQPSLSKPSAAPSTSRSINQSFPAFVQTMSDQLEVLSQDALTGTDFRIYQIRVGAGLTMKGTVSNFERFLTFQSVVVSTS